jgi:hypothetical protein
VKVNYKLKLTPLLYDSIAEIQADENLNRVLWFVRYRRDMRNTCWIKVRTIQSEYKMPVPSSRAKFQLKLGKLFGYGSIISTVKYRKQFAVNSIKNKIEKEKNLLVLNTIIYILLKR